MYKKLPKGSHAVVIREGAEPHVAYSDIGFQEAWDFAKSLGYKHYTKNYITEKQHMYVLHVVTE